MLVAQDGIIHIPCIGIGCRRIIVTRAGRDLNVLRTVFELTDFINRILVNPSVYAVNRVNLNRNRIGYQRILQIGAIVVRHNFGINVITCIKVVRSLQVIKRYRVAEVGHRFVTTVEIPVNTWSVTTILNLGQYLDVVQRTNIVTRRIIVSRTKFRMDPHETDFHNRIKSFYHTHRHGVGRYGRIGRERAHRTVAMEYGVYFVAVLQAALRYRIATGNEIAVAEPFDIPTV